MHLSSYHAHRLVSKCSSHISTVFTKNWYTEARYAMRREDRHVVDLLTGLMNQAD
jgi:hypothetical protein